MSRTYLNLEKHHIEILLQLVREEIVNPTHNSTSVWYLECILEDALEDIDNKM